MFLIIKYYSIFRHISKDVVWSSIVSHSSNSILDIELTDIKKSTNKKSTQNITNKECFPIKTTKGTQCYYDKTNLDYDTISSKSIVIAIKLSPTIYKVK